MSPARTYCDWLQGVPRPFKLGNAIAKERAIVNRISSRGVYDNVIPRLVGESNVTNIKVVSTECLGLIDTGSQVTTMSLSFHMQHCPGLAIHPLSNILSSEGAAGQKLPYRGYVEVEITVTDLLAGQPITAIPWLCGSGDHGH